MRTITATQINLFEEVKPKQKVMRDRVIGTVDYDQQKIIKWIMELFNEGEPFDCDPTFSKGVIWRGLPEPRFKFDLDPTQSFGVLHADARNIPLDDESIKSLFFDPPFLVATNKESIIKKRFSAFKSVKAMWSFYHDALAEFHRLLKVGGVLTIKCQDMVYGGDQYCSQYQIMRFAFALGYTWEDTFILVNNNQIISSERQFHGRKMHSYFIVFRKPKPKVTGFIGGDGI